MLRQRVLTAIALLAVLIPALFYPRPVVFVTVTLVLVAAAAWEWGRLNGVGANLAVAMGLASFLVCGWVWWADGVQALAVASPARPAGGVAVEVAPAWASLWVVAGLIWVLVGVWLLRRGVAGWPSVPRWVRVLLGMAALGLAWLAMAQARLVGINFLLSLLVLVWVADIGAYAFGKALGRHKLAPTISPGKSWEGVFGGMSCALGLAFAWRWLDSQWLADSASLYTRLSAHSTAAMLLAVVLLSAMSVVGDLTESLVKRSAGSKDSSRLLPGHGGVLDRIDALLPTLPLSLALLVVLGV